MREISHRLVSVHEQSYHILNLKECRAWCHEQIWQTEILTLCSRPLFPASVAIAFLLRRCEPEVFKAIRVIENDGQLMRVLWGIGRRQEPSCRDRRMISKMWSRLGGKTTVHLWRNPDSSRLVRKCDRFSWTVEGINGVISLDAAYRYGCPKIRMRVPLLQGDETFKLFKFLKEAVEEAPPDYAERMAYVESAYAEAVRYRPFWRHKIGETT